MENASAQVATSVIFSSSSSLGQWIERGGLDFMWPVAVAHLHLQSYQSAVLPDPHIATPVSALPVMRTVVEIL